MISLTEEDAREICTWRYPAPYDVYDYEAWDAVAAKGWDISLPEKREQEYVAFRNDGRLIGYGRIYPAAGYAMIGIGLRPDLCGRGNGEGAMRQLVRLARTRYPSLVPALEVRAFNLRAIRCYETCGFLRCGTYVRNTCTGRDTFVFMRYGGAGPLNGRDPGTGPCLR